MNMKILPGPIRLEIQAESLESFRVMLITILRDLGNRPRDLSRYEKSALSDSLRLKDEIDILISNEERKSAEAYRSA